MDATWICRTRWLAVATGLLMGASAVQAQHQPERVPRPGERRLNANTFKASHNSYERNETFASQLDDYNCWQLELDICWHGGDVRVRHCEGIANCQLASPDCSLGETLSQEMSDIAGSVTRFYKVTCIWLEMKCDGDFPDSGTYEGIILSAVHSALGTSQMYRPADFKDPSGDAGQWPSWQELIRRGKTYFVVFERSVDDTRHDDDNFFSVRYLEPGGPNNPHNSQVAFNHKHNEAELSLETAGDYWLSRAYPDPCCGEIGGPDYETEAEWETIVGQNHNTYCATNCVDWGYTMINPATHPPQPCFVDPSGSSDTEYGTFGFAYWGVGNVVGGGILGAMDRVADYGSSSEIWIRPGSYGIDPDGLCQSYGLCDGVSVLAIDKPMVLKCDSSNPLDAVVISVTAP